MTIHPTDTEIREALENPNTSTAKHLFGSAFLAKLQVNIDRIREAFAMARWWLEKQSKPSVQTTRGMRSNPGTVYVAQELERVATIIAGQAQQLSLLPEVFKQIANTISKTLSEMVRQGVLTENMLEKPEMMETLQDPANYGAIAAITVTNVASQRAAMAPAELAARPVANHMAEQVATNCGIHSQYQEKFKEAFVAITSIDSLMDQWMRLSRTFDPQAGGAAPSSWIINSRTLSETTAGSADYQPPHLRGCKNR